MTANSLPPVSAFGASSAMDASQQSGSRMKTVDPMRVLRQHMTLLIVTLILGVGLGVGAWYLLLQTMPRYRSLAQLQVNPGLENPMTDTVVQGQASGNMKATEAFIMNQVMLLTSQPVLDAVLAREAVRNTEWARQFVIRGEFDPIAAREGLLDATSATPLRGSTLIQVSFTDSRRNEVQVMLTHILEEYHRMVERLNSRQSASVKGTFSSMLQAAERDLMRLDQQMQAFLETHEITSLQANQTDAAINFAEITRQRAMLTFAMESARSTYEAMLAQAADEMLAPSPEELVQIDQSPPVAQRKEMLRQLNESRQVMLLNVGEMHPAIVRLDRQRIAVEQELERERAQQLREIREVRAEMARKAYEGHSADLEALQPKLQEAQARMTDLNIKLQQYNLLVTRREVSNRERDDIASLLRSIEVMERRADAQRVVTGVSPTDATLTFPMPHLVIPGVTMLLLLGVGGIVFLREMLDQRIKTPQDVKHLASVELLGMLPDAEEDPVGRGDLSDVVRRDPAGLLAESFRQVRTSLLTRMDRRGYKTLMLVGAQAQSGVSVVAANLAASLAYNGRKVLVMDANFRRPSQHVQFGLSPEAPGLVDVLQGRVSVDDAVKPLKDPDIDVLPAGATAGAYPEQLEGAAFRSLLATLESRYDLILIDTPPALVTSDSNLLAKQVDAIVFVVRAMQQKRGMIDRMLQQLSGHRGDVLGVVLNGVQSSAGGYFRKNYKAFYDYAGNGHSDRAKGGKRGMRGEAAAVRADKKDN